MRTSARNCSPLVGTVFMAFFLFFYILISVGEKNRFPLAFLFRFKRRRTSEKDALSSLYRISARFFCFVCTTCVGGAACAIGLVIDDVSSPVYLEVAAGQQRLPELFACALHARFGSRKRDTQPLAQFALCQPLIFGEDQGLTIL